MITLAEEFVRLRLSEVMEEYHRAAWEEAPIEVWVDVIERFPNMRKWVAHNKVIPDEVIEILSRDKDSDVRWVIAAKRKTPLEIKERLSRDEDASVRIRIAYNKKSPLSLVEWIMNNDPEQWVRETAKEQFDLRNKVKNTN